MKISRGISLGPAACLLSMVTACGAKLPPAIVSAPHFSEFLFPALSPPDPRQGGGDGGGLHGVIAGVGESHADLVEPAGVLVRLVGEGVPDDPVSGAGPFGSAGDVGVGAARQEEPLDAMAPAAQDLLRLVLEAEAVVIGEVEPAMK